MSSEQPSNTSTLPPPTYTREKALGRLEAYEPVGTEDKTLMFFKALLEHTPAKGNIAREIWHPSRPDVSEGRFISSDATIRLRLQWWQEHLIAACMSPFPYAATNELQVRGVGGSDKDTVLQDIPEAGRVNSFKEKVHRLSFVANGSFS